MKQVWSSRIERIVGLTIIKRPRKSMRRKRPNKKKQFAGQSLTLIKH